MKKINLSELEYLAVTPYKNDKIWSEAFSFALKNYEDIIIPAGKYYVDKSLVVPQNRGIIADENAEIILIKGVKSLLLRNENVIDGSDKPIPKTAIKDENISITGGIWGEENDERLAYGKSGCFDEKNSMVGVSTCFLLSNVKNLTLKNLTFRHTAGFAIQMGNISNFAVENICFDVCYADGLHINGGTENGTVKNLYGHTEDDLIALNAYDWDNSSINFGKIENLVVDGVKCDVGGNVHKSIRIQPGIYPYKSGEKEDCFVKNLAIKNVSGVACFKMYLQTPAYTTFPEKNVGVGRMENILFENISADTSEPVDKQPNYLSGNTVTGNFATFEIGSDVKNLTFNNVKTVLNKAKYPNSYFIAVGPKTQYIAEKKLELFDPYVCCTIQRINFENVYINNEKKDDLTGFIKEISYDNLYPSALPFGKGKIISVSKEKKK